MEDVSRARSQLSVTCISPQFNARGPSPIICSARLLQAHYGNRQDLRRAHRPQDNNHRRQDRGIRLQPG